MERHFKGERGVGGPGVDGSGLFLWPVMGSGIWGGICTEYQIWLETVSLSLLFELHHFIVSRSKEHDRDV